MGSTIRKKILVVDDEPETGIFLSNLLDSGGFAPVVSRSGAQQLEPISANPPALIIIDVAMPGQGPTRLYRGLKQHKQLKAIPVIMLSTLDRKTFYHCQKFHCAAAGRALPEPEAYIEKPPEADELLDLVNRLTQPAAGAGKPPRIK